MRDRDRWGHPYESEPHDEDYENRDVRYGSDRYAGERWESPPRRDRPHDESEMAGSEGPRGPLRGSRYMYDVDEDDRFYEGDYPRADMGGPYRYGAGRGRGRGPVRPRSGRTYPSIGDYTGVGSAEGYTGVGGPGWQSGGYGDPGFRTSSPQRRHHGADHSIGTDLPQDDIGTDRSTNWTGKGDTDAHLSRRDLYGHTYESGPHTGRGPKDYQRSEERIREDVCDRLTRNGAIDARDVEIDVNGGEVTLRGRVNGRRAKRLAEDVVEAVPGVREVYNNLRSESRD